MSVPATKQPVPGAEGHRERLRGRLIDDPDGLLDHELIEYMLTLVIPRVDVKPLAKRLLHEFGGIGGLLSATPEALRRVLKDNDRQVAVIRIAQATALRLLKAEAAARPVLSNWQALLDYLRADMAHALVERVRVLHLNTRSMLIANELVHEGTIDEAAVYTREVIRRAMELGSAAVILVHSHPSGDPKPSKSDIDLTRAIADAGKRLGIAVHDHVIIGTQGHASLRALGLI